MVASLSHLQWAVVCLGATLRVPSTFPGLEQALGAAASGDVITVAAGEYLLSRPLGFGGKDLVLRSEEGPGRTMLRLAEQLEDPGRASLIVFESGEREEAVLEGFTLTGGRGIGMNSFGGGVACIDSSPTIRNCWITGNEAQSGGGLACRGNSSPVLIDCTISENRAWFTGGGGIYAGEGSAPRLIRCVLANNYGRHDGGGIFCQGSAPVLINCVLSGNRAKDTGGGVYCRSAAAPTFLNCTMAENRAAFGGGGIHSWDASPRLKNCIVARNVPLQVSEFPLEPSAILLEYSCVEGEAWSGSGNIADDPLFACSGVHLLRPGSPAIDAGSREGAPQEDLGGRPRPCGAGVDMGALESCGDLLPVCFQRGDADVTGRLDVNDAVFVLRFLFLGGEDPPCQKSADAGDDGRLHIGDPVHILTHLFLGGAPPAEPLGSCGLDLTADPLSCDSYLACEQ